MGNDLPLLANYKIRVQYRSSHEDSLRIAWTRSRAFLVTLPLLNSTAPCGPRVLQCNARKSSSIRLNPIDLDVAPASPCSSRLSAYHGQGSLGARAALAPEPRHGAAFHRGMAHACPAQDRGFGARGGVQGVTRQGLWSSHALSCPGCASTARARHGVQTDQTCDSARVRSRQRT